MSKSSITSAPAGSGVLATTTLRPAIASSGMAIAPVARRRSHARPRRLIDPTSGSIHAAYPEGNPNPPGLEPPQVEADGDPVESVVHGRVALEDERVVAGHDRLR